MGVVGVEEFPYYAYGGYPSGARRVPIYNSSFPGQWSGDYSPYFDNSVYGGNPVPLFVVEAPFSRDANVVRKRKLDGLKGEVIPSGEHNARNVLVGNGSKSGASSSSSKPILSTSFNSREATPASRLPEARQVYPAKSKQSSSSSAETSSSHPRVISIPVTSTDEGKENIVECTVMPQEETKRLRKAMSAERAALLIQAWFRGTQVRNTQPVAQLRHIAKVKSQLVELDEKASDADFINYARENSAARVRLTEGIMKLLLQLDAIQGAHPIVREIRKLVTKEVISLQGRVDALLSVDEEPSQLPMETEQASGDDMKQKMVTGTESSASDAAATPMVDVDEEEDSRMQVAEPDPDEKRGEVAAADSSLASVELDASRADGVSANEANEILPRTTEPYPDQANRVIGEVAEASLEPMDSEAVESEITDVNKNAADEMEGVECEADEPIEAGGHHESIVENDSLANPRHEDGEKVERNESSSNRRNKDGEKAEQVGLARAETMPEAVEVSNVKINTSDEGAVQSGNISEASSQESSQRTEEHMEAIDGRIGNVVPTNSDLSEDEDGDVVHPFNEKGSLVPYSPRSPFEALDCLNFPASVSDGELPSEIQASRETMKDGSAQGNADTEALLLKLSEENKSLKSLLITVMKWNQMQATTMQEVNHRLRKLESKMSTRIDKKSNSRRRGSKSSQMML